MKFLLLFSIILSSSLVSGVEVGVDFIKLLNDVSRVKSIQEAKALNEKIEQKLTLKKNKVHLSLLNKRFLHEVENGEASKVLSEYRRIMTMFLTANSLREFNPRPSSHTIQRTRNLAITLGFFILAFFVALGWSLKLRNRAQAASLDLRKEIQQLKQATRSTMIEESSHKDVAVDTALQEQDSLINPAEFIEELLVDKLNFRNLSSLKIDESERLSSLKFKYDKNEASELLTRYLELGFGLQGLLKGKELELKFKHESELFSYNLYIHEARIKEEHLAESLSINDEEVALESYLQETEFFFKRKNAHLKIKNLKSADKRSVLVTLDLVEEQRAVSNLEQENQDQVNANIRA